MSAALLFDPFFIPLNTNGKRSFRAKYKHTIKRESLNEPLNAVRAGVIYKKSDGRCRTEERDETGKNDETCVVIIYNPVKEQGFLIDMESRTAYVVPISASPSQIVE